MPETSERPFDYEQLRESMRSLLHDVARYRREVGDAPVRGSQLGTELAAVPNSGPVRGACRMADMSIISAINHFEGFCRTVYQPVIPFVPWTCARGCLEASAHAVWLLDRQIDGEERARRGLCVLASAVSEAFRTSEMLRAHPQAAGRPKTQRASAAVKDFLKDIEDAANSLGFTLTRYRKSGFIRSVGGTQKPSITELIDVTLKDRLTYRYLSAIAHGDHLALLHGPPSEHGELSENSHHFFAIHFFDWLTRPIWLQFSLFGWDRDQLSARLKALADEIMVAPASRFWDK